MLRSIIYARFHSERGPVVLRQHPRHALFASQRNAAIAHDNARLIDFGDVSNYIIPPYELCNQALSVSTNGYCILGWPVSIEDQKYPRYRFTFNVCFVLDKPVDQESRTAWNVLVKKTARWFKSIEEEDGLLFTLNEDNDLAQSSGQDVEVDVVSKILEHAFQQLSVYGECCVKISNAHVLNLRLSVQRPQQHKAVQSWEVPLLIADLPSQENVTWDLVLQRMHAHINGINHVYRIAELADVESQLAISTIDALVAANRVLMLDIFHFQAIYAHTEDLAWFIKDEDMLAECVQYISTGDKAEGAIHTNTVIEVYLALKPGLTVASLCATLHHHLKHIDVRRLVTFGVIKGFLRRIHKFAKAAESSLPAEVLSRPVTSLKRPYEDAVEEFEQAWRQTALSSGWATPPSDLPLSVRESGRRTVDDVRREEDEKLKAMLNGRHCFDEICVKLGMSETRVMERINSGRFGEVTTFTK